MKEKNLVFLLSSSTVVTITWIGFSLYHTAVTSTLDPLLTTQIQPIQPLFNDAIIQQILNREDVPPTYELSGQAAPIATAPAASIPNISPTPRPAPSVTPEPTMSESGGDEAL